MTIQVALQAIGEATKLLARRTAANRLTMFHGTASGPNNSRLRSILKHGLIPTAPKAWADDPNAKQAGHRSRAAYGGTYFSGNPRVAFSSVHQSRGKDPSQYPVIITATIQPRAALPDEDDYVGSVDHAYSYATKTVDHPHTDGYYYLCLFLDDYNQEDLKEARQRFADSLADMLKRYGVSIELPRLKKFTDPLFDAEVVRRVSNQPDDWYGFKRSVQGRALEYFKYYKETPLELDQLPAEIQKQPTYEEGEAKSRAALDALTKATRRLAIGLETHAEDAADRFRHVLRVMEPVTFRGRNRITSIVSLPNYYSRSTGTPVTVVSHYGDPTPVVKYLESEGYTVEVVSPKSASAVSASSDWASFEELPKEAQLSATEYLNEIEDYPPEQYRWRLEMVPVDELKRRVFTKELSEESGQPDFDSYHQWYLSGTSVPTYKDRWPVLTWPTGVQSGGEYLQDGWHRFHSYIRSGDKAIPVLHRRLRHISASAVYTDESGKFWGSQGAGAIFMAEDTGRILLQHRSPYVNEPNTWGVIGGAIDSGEDPQEAMEREVHEETGYGGPMRVEKLYVFQSGKFRYTNFLVIVPHEFSPRHGWESQGHVWATLDDLPEPLHFGFKAALPSLQQRLGQEAVSASNRRNHGNEEESIRALCARVEARLRVRGRGHSRT